MADFSIRTRSPANLSLPHRNLFVITPPTSPLSTQELDNDIIDLDQASPLSADTYQQLYHDAFDMHTNKSHTPESKIDSELRSLASGDRTMKKNVLMTDTMEPLTPKTPKTPTLKRLNSSLSVKSVSSPRSPQIPRPNSRSKSFHDNNFFPLSP